MEIIDAQLHEIGPRLGWAGADRETRHDVLTELIFAWMDAVGVDRALVHPRDAGWAAGAIAAHPQRLAAVYTVRDPAAPDVAEQLAEAKRLPGAVGVRLIFGKVQTDPTGEAGVEKLRSGAFNGFLRACESLGLPLFCGAFGHARLIGEIARAHEGLRIVVDHLGMAQPPLNPRLDPPWRELPDLLGLAGHANVAVKLCGVPVLSDRRYPFEDVWPHLLRILDAFGSERLMWASDIGRFTARIGWENDYPRARGDYPGKHGYAESLFFLLGSDRLSAFDKEAILGGTVRKLLGWPGSSADSQPAKA